MKKNIYLFILILFISNVLYSQTDSIKDFIIINWTNEQYNSEDILFTNEGEEERSFFWEDTLRSYSIKKIQLQSNTKYISMKGVGSLINVMLNESGKNYRYVLAKRIGASCYVKPIVTALSGQIVGLNICDNPNTFGRVQQFLVANLSRSKVTINNITYMDTQQKQFNSDIEPYSIGVFNIDTINLGSNYYQGKEIRQYSLTYDHFLQNANDIRYKADSCIFSTTQDMIVGVEISNSGTDDSLKVVW